jgi:hypothetical protein
MGRPEHLEDDHGRRRLGEPFVEWVTFSHRAPVDVFPRSPSLLLLQEARRLEELRMAAIEERRPYMKVFKGSRCISAKAAELQERWSGLLPGLL